MYMAGTTVVWLVALGLLGEEARYRKMVSGEEQMFFTPQRVLEGIEPADLSGAIEVLNEEPWGYIARLVPSVYTDFPTLCNLVYIDFAIYLAPMKCLIGVDTKVVAIRHKKFLLYVEVSILPDEQVSASYFDDVGFLIAKSTSITYKLEAKNISRANVTKLTRTGNNYDWVKNLEGSPFYQLIGFVDIGLNLAKRYRQFTRLYIVKNVTFSMSQCNEAVQSLQEPATRDSTPCVLLCQQATCKRRFLYTLGSLLLNHEMTVIGISTWQDNIDIRYLNNITHPPIGMAIPNKNDYVKNFNCAVKIRDYHYYNDSEPLKYSRDYSLYDKLCKANRKLKRSRAPIII